MPWNSNNKTCFQQNVFRFKTARYVKMLGSSVQVDWRKAISFSCWSMCRFSVFFSSSLVELVRLSVSAEASLLSVWVVAGEGFVVARLNLSASWSGARRWRWAWRKRWYLRADITRVWAVRNTIQCFSHGAWLKEETTDIKSFVWSLTRNYTKISRSSQIQIQS